MYVIHWPVGGALTNINCDLLWPMLLLPVYCKIILGVEPRHEREWFQCVADVNVAVELSNLIEQ